MPTLQIVLLGGFQVSLSGQPIARPRTRKVQALLAYLAVEADQTHRREILAGLLWPDLPEATARRNLRQTLYYLRQIIPEAHLRVTPHSIRLNPERDCEVDVTTFSHHLHTCRRHTHAALTTCRPCLARLQQAADLYRGDFLADFFLADNTAFEEWAWLKREWLRSEALWALSHLTAGYERIEDYDRATRAAHQWVMLDPLQEEGHRQLMRLLALSGRRSEALAQFETCRKRLVDELGVEPAPETITLAEQIRNGSLAYGDAPEQNYPPPTHTLPRPLTPLVGRESELEALSKLLTDPGQRLITILGPGGVGKSHLALTAAARTDHFAHGVYFVSLAPLQSAAGIAPAIAEALQFTFHDDRSPTEQLLDYLRRKAILLLLDNFEHLLPDTGLLVDLLKAAPDLKILVTSRTRLQLQGEQIFPLTGLAYPAQSTPRLHPRRYGALTLFERSAVRHRPNFALTEDNLSAATRICRLVEGMPLGLLLAAPWIVLMSPDEIAVEIEAGFGFLQAELGDLPPRQQSMQAVFDHSWRLLSASEQDAFRRLAIFRGDFTRQAAQAVTGASLSTLMALVHKSFLRYTPAGRYQIHELLRQYGLAHLRRLPAVETEARDRHSTFYTHFMDQREADLKGSRQKEALLEIELDDDNILAAWDRAVQQRQIAHLDQALESLGLFYTWRGRYEAGETACRTAAEALETDQSGAAIHLLIRLLTWQAAFNRLLGHSDLAGQLARQALNLLDSPALVDLDTRPAQAALLLEIGLQTDTNNLAAAAGWYEQSLVLYRALADPWGTAEALYWLGKPLPMEPGRYDEGRRYLTESLQLREQLGDRRGRIDILWNLGFAAMMRGECDDGEPLLRQALTLCRELDDQAATVMVLRILGFGLQTCGRYTESHALVVEALTLAQDLGHRPLIAMSTVALAIANKYLGHYKTARRQAEYALQIFRDMNNVSLISFVLWQLGDLALAERSYAEAETWLKESLRIYQETTYKGRGYPTMTSLGYAVWGLGQLEQTKACLSFVLPSALEDRQQAVRVRAFILAALISLTEGEPGRAVEYYALASSYPEVANAPWFEDIAGRHVKLAAAELPPEFVTAAEARGRARDPEETLKELLADFEAR